MPGVNELIMKIFLWPFLFQLKGEHFIIGKINVHTVNYCLIALMYELTVANQTNYDIYMEILHMVDFCNC